MSSRTTARNRPRWPAIGGVAIVAAGAGVYAATRSGAQDHPRTPLASAVRPTTTTSSGPPAPITLTRTLPASGAKTVPATSAFTFSFSTPLAANSALPSFSPDVPGTWSGIGTTTLVFHPSARLTPYEHLEITIPGGSAGVSARDGTALASATKLSVTVGGVSMLRLQQLLAELDYLPVAFVRGPASSTTTSSAPAGGSPSSTAALDAEPTTPSAVPLQPVAGTFAWRFPNIPSQLAASWQAGAWNVATKGAVMAFEADHGLGVDGEPGPLVWSALLKAVAQRDVTTRPYDYLITTETEPETLYVWRDGSVIYSSLANTGVTGATTQLGTFPVYLRYLSATMSGTNPNGSHYSDPGIPYIAYFNGSDAVHGFIRSSYGFPQSDGCVELPVADAAVVWPLDPYGTLVTVTTGNLASELQVTSSPADGSGSGVPTTPTSTTTTTTVVPSTSAAPTTSIPAG